MDRRIAHASAVAVTVLVACSTTNVTNVYVAPDASSSDAGGDASDGATAPDAGCGPVNTPDNCGSCGNKCITPDAGLFATSACCGTSCVVHHFDGYYDFYDCEAAGKFTQQLALDACAVYFGGAKCMATTCGASQVVEGTSQACITWAYGGDPTAIGHVKEGAVAGPCQCPTSSDTTWN